MPKLAKAAGLAHPPVEEHRAMEAEVVNGRVLAVALGAVLLATGAAGAQAQYARFSMVPVEEGALRLDTQTGMVTLCGRKDGYWLCEALPEEQDALRREIDRLTEENLALRSEVEELRAQLAQRDANEGLRLRLPTEQEMEQLMTAFEKMMRRFQNMIEQLTQPQPQPPPRQL